MMQMNNIYRMADFDKVQRTMRYLKKQGCVKVCVWGHKSKISYLIEDNANQNGELGKEEVSYMHGCCFWSQSS